MREGALIDWLRACYQDDRTRVGIRDFFGSGVKHRRMTRGRERLVNDELTSDVLLPSYAEKLIPFVELHRRERQAVYGSIWLAGKVEGKPIRSPLILYPVELGTVEQSILSIDRASWRLNPECVRWLDLEREQERELERIFVEGVLDELMVGRIQNFLREYVPFVKNEELERWPKLSSTKEVNALAGAGVLTMIPASGLGVVERSRNSRGVLDELELMKPYSRGELSPALKAFLDSQVELFKDRRGEGGSTYFNPFLPVTLSQSQKRILNSSRSNTISLCYGPPGTGKSFTLAAIALDHMARGESVLMVSRGEHAVEALFESLYQMIGSKEGLVRAGRSHYLAELKELLESSLNGLATMNAPTKIELVDLEKNLKVLGAELEKEERFLERELSKSCKRGKVMMKESASWTSGLRQWYTERAVRKRPLLLQIARRIENLHKLREHEVRKVLRLRWLYQLKYFVDDPNSRLKIQAMLKGLRKRRGSEQEKAFENVDVKAILKVLPVWLIEAEDVHRVLPFERELFDVVVIDEASQCDLTTCIPVIQRASRIVVAGDQKQLRHISFLSKTKMKSHAQRIGVSEKDQEVFDYRKRSLMDLITEVIRDQKQVGFLNEHFRSVKPIIQFSNNRYYSNQLKLMRERPWDQVSGALSVRYCDGVRNGTGVNEKELKLMYQYLEEFVEQGQRIGVYLTIGVLSPYRKQVDAFLKGFHEKGRLSLLQVLRDKHSFALGTAHGFQGRERDVMLISTVIDKNSSSSGLRFMEREDVFNVSVTRAKDKQVLFTSVRVEDLPSSSVLADYITNAEGKLDSRPSVEKVSDVFSKEVTESLCEVGLNVIGSQDVAGIGVDLMVRKGRGSWLGIDLVGLLHSIHKT